MASSEGIRSPFPTQPPAVSPKLRLYECLFLWNQGIDQLLATLRGMENLPFARKSALQHAQNEMDDAGRFHRQRRSYEKQREDPDDVYIDVERREQERKTGVCRHVSALSPIPQ